MTNNRRPAAKLSIGSSSASLNAGFLFLSALVFASLCQPATARLSPLSSPYARFVPLPTNVPYAYTIAASEKTTTPADGAFGAGGAFANNYAVWRDPRTNTLTLIDHMFHIVRQLLLPSPSSVPTVETIAGTPGDYGFLNGPRLTAKFNSPSGAVVFSANIASPPGPRRSFIISDTSNNCLRMIATEPPYFSNVETFSGTCAPFPQAGGYSEPSGIDATSDYVYVADQLNGCIKRVDANGVASVAVTQPDWNPRFITVIDDGSALVITKTLGLWRANLYGGSLTQINFGSAALQIAEVQPAFDKRSRTFFFIAQHQDADLTQSIYGYNIDSGAFTEFLSYTQGMVDGYVAPTFRDVTALVAVSSYELLVVQRLAVRGVFIRPFRQATMTVEANATRTRTLAMTKSKELPMTRTRAIPRTATVTHHSTATKTRKGLRSHTAPLSATKSSVITTTMEITNSAAITKSLELLATPTGSQPMPRTATIAHAATRTKTLRYSPRRTATKPPPLTLTKTKSLLLTLTRPQLVTRSKSLALTRTVSLRPRPPRTATAERTLTVMATRTVNMNGITRTASRTLWPYIYLPKYFLLEPFPLTNATAMKIITSIMTDDLNACLVPVQHTVIDATSIAPAPSRPDVLVFSNVSYMRTLPMPRGQQLLDDCPMTRLRAYLLSQYNGTLCTVKAADGASGNVNSAYCATLPPTQGGGDEPRDFTCDKHCISAAVISSIGFTAVTAAAVILALNPATASIVVSALLLIPGGGF